MRAQRLDRERAGDADLLRVLERLVVEELEVGVPLDRRVDLARASSFLDVRVIRDRLQRDVLDAVVDEAVADVARRTAGAGGRCAVSDCSFAWPSAESASRYHGIPRPHDPLPGESERDSRRVDRDPAPAPLLGDEGRGARSAGRIEHEVARDR